MDTLRITRHGGFAGFGAPGGRLVSRGEVVVDALSPRERDQVDALFRVSPEDVGEARDTFTYVITRQANGHEQTVELPESQVPTFLLESVKDELI